jgi:hypothetical protein
LLNGSSRPIIAETEPLVVVACGRDAQKIEIATDTSSRLGGLDTWATHIIQNDLRLLANDSERDRTKVRYSNESIGTTDFSGHEDWAVTGVRGEPGFFSAESRADRVKAIGENSNEVFVWGTGTLEVWKTDETYVYAPVGSAKEYGCIAPYSIIKDDKGFAWLDSRKRFVISDGRNLEVISDEIGATLNGITTFTDCFGYRVHEDPVDMLVWTFPTDGRTFAYQKGIGWSQWAKWDSATTNWTKFPVNCCHHRQDTDVNVVGTTDGYMGKFEMGATEDLGTRVVCYVRSGFQNRKTDARKMSNALYLGLERGETSGTEPVCSLSWADEPGGWTTPIPISLGASGDRAPVIPLRSLGVYRKRDWKFEFSADENLKLSSVIEDFTVLES